MRCSALTYMPPPPLRGNYSRSSLEFPRAVPLLPRRHRERRQGPGPGHRDPRRTELLQPPDRVVPWDPAPDCLAALPHRCRLQCHHCGPGPRSGGRRLSQSGRGSWEVTDVLAGPALEKGVAALHRCGGGLCARPRRQRGWRLRRQHSTAAASRSPRTSAPREPWVVAQLTFKSGHRPTRAQIRAIQAHITWAAQAWTADGVNVVDATGRVLSSEQP